MERSEKNRIASGFATQHTTPDDLTGALGSFNIYAAVATAKIFRHGRTGKPEVEVSGIWIHVKDNYSLTDLEGSRSQYLGHWSKERVTIVPYAAAAERLKYIPYLKTPTLYINAPVSIGSRYTNGNVHYPTRRSLKLRGSTSARWLPCFPTATAITARHTSASRLPNGIASWQLAHA